MYKICIVFIICIFCFASCSDDNPVVEPAPPNPSDTLGTIIGRITDELNQGIQGVNVISVVNGSYNYGYTDSSGNYSIVNVPSGFHTIITYKNGYRGDTLTITINQGDTIQADFQLQQTYWYKVSDNRLSSAHAYYNLYINPSQVLFASNRASSWMGGSLSGFIKSSNVGTSWQPVIYNGSATEIYKITDNNLFIFTAKGQDGNGNYIGENKLYRSNDFGENWQELVNLGLEQIDGHKLIGMNNGTLFFNIYGWRTNNNIFYLYKSVNQGASWSSYFPVSGFNVSGLNKTSSGKVYIRNYTDTLYFSANGNDWTKKVVTDNAVRSYIINSIVLPTGEMIAFAGNSQYAISNNDGDSWSIFATNLTYYPSPSRFNFNSNNDILGIVNNQSNNAYGVYKSSNKGQTWILIDDGLPENYAPISLALFQDYGYLLCSDGYLYKTSKATTETSNVNIKYASAIVRYHK